MKKLFIVANWKSNMTSPEAASWFREVERLKLKVESDKEIIVCGSFTLLSVLKSLILNLKSNVRLGAQDISPFPPGAYTGEVNGEQIKEFAEYVLVGHSERRKNFNETDELLEKKVQQSLRYALTPIFCVQGTDTKIPEGVFLIAYEPIFAIGTGNPDTPENANKIAEKIKEKNKEVTYVLYGGSVKGDNVHNFTSQPALDGVLVGGASLETSSFSEIIQNA